VENDIGVVQERYHHFITQPEVQGFLAAGGTVTLATEHREAHLIEALLQVGHRHFAEKYVQEAVHKVPALNAAWPETRWHFFGALQTNKMKSIHRLFPVLETLSARHQADRLCFFHRAHGESSPLRDVFVQVNLGREPQKGGADPDDAPALIEYVLEAGLPLTGLMTIPPKADPPAMHFTALRTLANRYALPYCQMGFSADYRVAIDCGATHIRLGTAIFGPLPPRP